MRVDKLNLNLLFPASILHWRRNAIPHRKSISVSFHLACKRHCSGHSAGKRKPYISAAR